MKILHSLSIKNKIIFIILLVSVIITATGFAIAAILSINNYKKELVNSTILSAKLSVENLISPLLFEDNKGVYEVISKLEAIPEIECAIVYNNEHNVLAEYYSTNKKTEKISFQSRNSYKFYNRYLHVWEMISYEQIHYGHIYLIASTTQLRSDIRNYITSMLIALMILIICAYLLALRLQKLISKPIIDLAFTVERISKTSDYSKRLKKKFDDETGLLYDRFNDLMEKIQKRELEKENAKNETETQKKRFLTIIESFTETIYVSDPESYLVLFANKNLKNRIGKDPVGKRCFKELHGKEKPCEFCTNEIILKDRKPHIWEFYNKLLKKHYLITDQIIKWPDGRDVRFEVAIDITKRKNAEDELRDYKERLEVIVKSRTEELENRNEELERFNKLFIGREFRIKDLKEKIKSLEEEIDRRQ